MTLLLLLARLLLCLVFLIAGLAKLADLAGSQRALRDFGVPAPLAAPLGILLPLVELSVAVALIASLSFWWGAPGALTLLLLFISGIGSNLAQGRQPNCHCFGQLHAAPAGWPTLIRNLVLAALAGILVAFGRSTPGPGMLNWMYALTMSQRIELVVGVVVLALLIGEGWLLWQILRQQGRLLLRLETVEARLSKAGLTVPPPNAWMAGLPVDTSAPGFALATLTGETISLTALCALCKPVVLVFSDPACGPCTALLPEIGRWQRDYGTKVVVALISQGTAKANRANVFEYGLTHVLLQQDREVAEAYLAAGTPSAVLVRRDGTIGSPLVAGAEAIGALMTSTVILPMLGALPPAAAATGQSADGSTNVV